MQARTQNFYPLVIQALHLAAPLAVQAQQEESLLHTDGADYEHGQAIAMKEADTGFFEGTANLASSGDIFVARYASPFYDCSAQADMPEAEREAYVARCEATDGANWTDRSGWLEAGTPVYQMHGVTVVGGHVTALVLSRDNLQGSIPIILRLHSGREHVARPIAYLAH